MNCSTSAIVLLSSKLIRTAQELISLATCIAAKVLDEVPFLLEQALVVEIIISLSSKACTRTSPRIFFNAIQMICGAQFFSGDIISTLSYWLRAVSSAFLILAK